MRIVELPIEHLKEARWNANEMDPAMAAHLDESLDRYGLVQNLVVRPLGDGNYEVISGNQRFQSLLARGHAAVPCVVVDLDDTRARLLSQALNRIHGEDDLGLRAELVRNVLANLPQEEVLALLPETAESLNSLAALGQEDMAGYLDSWQQAQQARLKHMQFQLTPMQLEVVDEALARVIPEAKSAGGDSPNLRGTALYLICKRLLELEEETP